MPVPLKGHRDAAVLECPKCAQVFPLLAGIPILVSDPAHYVATYRESILACLAESGAATAAAVKVVESFAAAVPRQEPMRFGDDWVADEGTGHAALEVAPKFASTLGAFVAQAQAESVDGLTLEWVASAKRGRILEVGCGGGALSRGLSRHGRELFICDLSLRAVLRGVRAARRSGCAVQGVVANVEALPFAASCFDAVTCINVLDLVDDPAAAAAELARVLRSGGLAAVSSPEPSLGDPFGDSQALDELLADNGLEGAEAHDDVPWLRPHHDRHWQIYFVRALRAVKRRQVAPRKGG